MVVTPDQAAVLVTIRTLSQDPAEAQSENEVATDAVFEALTQGGIDPDSISLTDLRLRPRTSYGGPDGPRDDGFEATRSLRVVTSEIDAVSHIAAVATTAGATSIDQVEYSSSHLDEARLEALTEAVRLARRDAEAMAKAADGSLVGLALLTTNPSTFTPMQVRGARIVRGFGRSETTPDAADLTVTVIVEGQWVFRANE